MKRLYSRTISFITFMLMAWPGAVFAHGEAGTGNNLDELIARLSTQTVWLAVILIALLLLVTVLIRRKTNHIKRTLFWSYIFVIATSTIFLIGLTVAINISSWSKGPVHWHADMEVWACGKKLDLRDPTRVSNRVGSRLYHEHNDERLHIEGIVADESDIALENFFFHIGGDLRYSLTEDGVKRLNVTYPTTNGPVTYVDDDSCVDGTQGVWQAFLYQVDDDKRVTQTQVSDPLHYMPAHSSQVPPGDCLILEFGTPKDRTQHMCRSYEVALRTGKVKE